MSSTPFFKELLCLAIQMAETLSERIPKSGPLQSDCKHTATSLRTWRKKLPSDMEFLLRSTGDKSLYHAILLPLSDLLCILCQLIWTAHEQGHPPPLETLTHANDAEQKIKSASPSIKKYMDDLGVWQKPKKGHAPLAVLFDQSSRSNNKVFGFAEKAVRGHMSACYDGLTELTGRIDRARKRHVGLRLLAGKAT